MSSGSRSHSCLEFVFDCKTLSGGTSPCDTAVLGACGRRHRPGGGEQGRGQPVNLLSTFSALAEGNKKQSCTDPIGQLCCLCLEVTDTFLFNVRVPEFVRFSVEKVSISLLSAIFHVLGSSLLYLLPAAPLI